MPWPVVISDSAVRTIGLERINFGSLNHPIKQTLRGSETTISDATPRPWASEHRE